MPLVTQELGRLSQTLGRGISDLGTSRLSGERQKTLGAELDYRLGRNRIQDERAGEKWELARPGAELGAVQSEAALEKAKQPASWGGEAHDVFSAMMLAKTAPKLAKLYNAKADTSSGQLQMVRPDGSVVMEIDRDKQAEAAAFLSTYKAASTYKDQIARIEETEQMLDAQGIPVLDPARQNLAGNKAKAQAVLDSPERMLRVLRGQLDQLNKLGHYPEDIKRIKGEIKDQEAKLSAQAKFGLEERKVRVLEEKVNIDLSPSETAEKAALLKRYGNNLQIQKQFKAGYDEFLGVQTKFKDKDFEDAVSDNDQIMRRLKQLGTGAKGAVGARAPIAPANIPVQVGELLKSTTPQELMSRFEFLKGKVKEGKLSVDDYNSILRDPKMQERFKSLKEPEKDTEKKARAQLSPKKAKQLSVEIDEYTEKYGIPNVPALKNLAEKLKLGTDFIKYFFIGNPASVIIKRVKDISGQFDTETGKPIA